VSGPSPAFPASLGRNWIAAASVACTFLAGGLVVLPRTGMSFDEPAHRGYGRRIVRYYETGGRDRSFLHHSNDYLYGGLFDGVAALVERARPNERWIDSNHQLVLLAGALGVFFAGLVAGRFAGMPGALLGALFLALTPRWFGHSLFNPKDIPFAAAVLAGVYALVRIGEELPRVKLNHWLLLGLSAGCALGVRFGGVAVFAYLAIALATAIAADLLRRWRGRSVSPGWESWPRIAWGGFVATAVSLAIGWLATPYLHADLSAHLRELRAATLRFDWPLQTFLGGRFLRPVEAARQYLPTWLAITLPPATCAGLLLLPFTGRRLAGAAARRPAAWAALLSASVLAPVWAVVARTPLYDGIRQVLFAIAPLTLLAALGWAGFVHGLGARGRRIAFVVLAVLLLEPLSWTVRAGPLAYTYFNPVSGGFARASWRYDTDYWGLSGREMAARLDEIATYLPPGARLAVEVSGIPEELVGMYLARDTRVDLVAGGKAARWRARAIQARFVRLPRLARLERRAVAASRPIVEGQRPFFVVVASRRVERRLRARVAVPLLGPPS